MESSSNISRLQIDCSPANDYDWFAGTEAAVIPERRLMCEVLKRAVMDLKGDKLSGYALRHYQLSARRWFEGKNEQDYLYSFRSVCRFLNLDARTILHRLQELGYLK